MTKDEFTKFTVDAIEDVIRLAEEKVGQEVSRRVAFSWLGSKEPPIRADIVETIVNKVFVSDEEIYPCVDLGLIDVLDDETPLLSAGVAGFAPRPFGKNWTGRDGPFVRIIGGAFVRRMAGEPYKERPGAIGFSIPDVPSAE